MFPVCLGAVQLTHTSSRPEQRGGCRCSVMGRPTAGQPHSLRGWGQWVLLYHCLQPAGDRHWILEQGQRIPQLAPDRAGWPQVGSWLADAFAPRSPCPVVAATHCAAAASRQVHVPDCCWFGQDFAAATQWGILFSRPMPLLLHGDLCLLAATAEPLCSRSVLAIRRSAAAGSSQRSPVYWHPVSSLNNAAGATLSLYISRFGLAASAAFVADADLTCLPALQMHFQIAGLTWSLGVLDCQERQLDAVCSPHLPISSSVPALLECRPSRGA